MEFHVKNSYVKKFLSKFKGQNELKLLKYVSIIGINSILNQEENFKTFSDIKKHAKSITKKTEKDERKLNNELKVIKNELAKLNEKFEEKMKAVAQKKNEGNLRIQTETNLITENKGFSSPKTSTIDIQKRRNLTTSVKKEDKVTSVERNESQKEKNSEISKSRFSITPKPTEISIPLLNPNLNRNTVTRHHLDDSQAKALLKEEGVVYFPKKESPKSFEQINSKLVSEQPSAPVKNDYQSIRNEQITKHDENVSSQTSEEAIEKYDENPELKSPHFAKQGEERKKNFLPERDIREDKENKTSNQVIKNKVSDGDAPKSIIKPNTLVEESKKMEKKIMRDKSRRKNAIGKPANTLNLNEVGSKIRDKVLKDRNNERGERRNEADDNKFVFLENNNPRYNSRNQDHLFKPSRYDYNKVNNSKFAESTISTGNKSINIPNYSGSYANLTPPQISSSRREPFEISNRLDEYTGRRNLDENANENYLGMLDIANSFLNSPLMNQLSGLEKSIGTSLKDSSYNIGEKKNYSNSKVATFEVRSPREKQSQSNSDAEDGNRYQESNHHRIYDWNSGARSEFAKSYLKESSVNNRKYLDNLTKDSRLFHRDENSSLASSNFSNFLNDEMKGFYQKETFDVNQVKQRRDQKSNSGDNSSNISFNGNDYTHPEDATTFLRKSTNYNGLDISKNYASYDKNNVFKQERMSVSRVLNN